MESAYTPSIVTHPDYIGAYSSRLPSYAEAMTTTNLPTRSRTQDSDDEVIPDGDPSDTTGLLRERLRAWKHVCGHLENYISSVARDQNTQAKDQEKMLKVLNQPIKEPHHFDTQPGGVNGLFENLRSNTLAQANMLTETSKNLTSQVLPILERLHAEIKAKDKELMGGAAKGSKAVDASRGQTQHHIELLGRNTAIADSTGGKVDAKHDPYVLQRGVYHRLNKQVLDENNNRQELLGVQSQFQQFEAHVMTTFQAALKTFEQFMGAQAERQKAIYGDITSNAQRIPLDYEWNGFAQRNGHVLLSPNAPPRSMNNISFPNQNHRATKALIEGTLERRSRGMGVLKGYSSGYYIVTPAGYLHEYKDDDNFRKDPTPEVSLYLPDCIVGALDGTKFAIKGKDSSGGKVGQKLSISSEFNFKALTTGDAHQWHSIIQSQSGGSSNSVPVSPVESRNVTPLTTHNDYNQQSGIVGGPQSATSNKMTSPTNMTSPNATGAGTHFGR